MKKTFLVLIGAATVILLSASIFAGLFGLTGNAISDAEPIKFKLVEGQVKTGTYDGESYKIYTESIDEVSVVLKVNGQSSPKLSEGSSYRESNLAVEVVDVAKGWFRYYVILIVNDIPCEEDGYICTSAVRGCLDESEIDADCAAGDEVICCKGVPYCGDGVCLEYDETAENCPTDCGSVSVNYCDSSTCTIKEGVTTIITHFAENFDVILDWISSSAVTLEIDGESTSVLSVGQSELMPNGIKITINEIYYPGIAGEPGFVKATFETSPVEVTYQGILDMLASCQVSDRYTYATCVDMCNSIGATAINTLIYAIYHHESAPEEKYLILLEYLSPSDSSPVELWEEELVTEMVNGIADDIGIGCNCCKIPTQGTSLQASFKLTN